MADPKQSPTKVSGSASLAPAAAYAVLPLRDIVVFPHMIVPLFVGREKSIRALEEVMESEQPILLLTQRNAQQDEPAADDLYRFGTLGTVLQLLRLPDGTVKVLIEGVRRARVVDFIANDSYFEATAAPVEEVAAAGDPAEVDALLRTVVGQFDSYIKLNKKIPPEVMVSLGQEKEPAKLADNVASHLTLKIADKQELLETVEVSARLEKVFGFMEGEIGVLQVERRIRSRVKKQMEKTQREYYLNEQMKAIQRELGDESGEGKSDADEYSDKLRKTKLSKEAREKAEGELKKLRGMSPMSAEATVVRNYLDWMLSVPWSKRTKVKKDLAAAETLLDEQHYGLDKVKERILEYLAVQTRTAKVKGPILCLVGPPGVGKTSLGKSIAEATGRNFVRMSLGGVRDESEIRGHRRTYIGSMPGRVVQGMKKAKSSNPLFLLDEVDKLGADWRGDPSAALLEVLDPEQNATFNDHYLEVDYDLSDVMFVCTANSLNMPQPLLDRMEIIRVSGYTEEEKIEIAKRHLLDKQIEANALKPGEFKIADEALRDLIRHYTREAGVRNLERELANLCRKAVKEIVSGQATAVEVTPETLEKFAGVRRFKYGAQDLEDLVGITTGLAWTEVGGELLSIEAVTLPGKGRITITGKLGDVMKESVQAAESLVRSRAVSFGIKPTLFEKRDIHVHVPEGATPKDGPSAGVAMVTSIVSVLTGIPVRKEVAMTGEISLRGRVMPIGGLKEKLLAALHGGLSKVLIPQDNVKDLAEISDTVKTRLEIVPVATVEQVLQHALLRELTPIEWTEVEESAMDAAKTSRAESDGGTIRH